MENKVGRNDPCPCGSGKKYKNCCMKKDEESKKTYTAGGKRKFKATVISSALDKTKSVFLSQPSGETKPASYVFLKFKQTPEDYRMEAEPAELPFEIPNEHQSGFQMPEIGRGEEILPAIYVMTEIDYRINS